MMNMHLIFRNKEKMSLFHLKKSDLRTDTKQVKKEKASTDINNMNNLKYTFSTVKFYFHNWHIITYSVFLQHTYIMYSNQMRVIVIATK